MKTQIRNMFMSSDIAEMEQLPTEVKDRVVAIGVIAPRSNVFCAADLWNIQKMRRIREPRKMFI
ncbi:MAG: hypothetical protein ACTHJ5_11335 [Ilyomonas sp.]